MTDCEIQGGPACPFPTDREQAARTVRRLLRIFSGCPALLLGLALLAGCGESPAATQPEELAPAPTPAPPLVVPSFAKPPSAERPFTPYPPPISKSFQPPRIRPAADSASQAALLRDQANFAVRLYHTLCGAADQNLVFAPWSLYKALAITAAGASGETQEQLAGVLGVEALDPSRLVAHNALDWQVFFRDPKFRYSPHDAFASSAERLWIDRGKTVHPAFLQSLAENYGGGAETTDFSTDPVGTRRRINGWVSDATAGSIPQLLPATESLAETSLMLVSALYFRGAWHNLFDTAQTETASFELLDGNQVEVPLMRQKQHYRWNGNASYTAVEITYRGPYGMIVILPTGDFRAFEANLDGESLRGIVDGLHGDPEVTLALPRFSIDQRHDLVSGLRALGVTYAFQPADADFSRALDPGQASLGDLLQQCRIDVDEQGTEASAATAVRWMSASTELQELELTLDRPFMFLITHQETGAVLFLGRMLDPRS